jgi:rare lipoprotein A
MYHMTAAHKTLPLPSFAQVTNLENGRQTIVKINDRGPFVGNRLIDLSYAAAQKLGVHAHGTAAVEVRSIDRPIAWTSDADGLEVAQAAADIANANASNTAAKDLRLQSPALLAAKPQTVAATSIAGAKPAQATTVATNAAGRYLQVGAFEDRKHAEDLRRALSAASLQDTVAINPLENNGKTLYRVWIGPIKNETANNTVVYNLTRLGIGQREIVSP